MRGLDGESLDVNTNTYKLGQARGGLGDHSFCLRLGPKVRLGPESGPRLGRPLCVKAAPYCILYCNPLILSITVSPSPLTQWSQIPNKRITLILASEA